MAAFIFRERKQPFVTSDTVQMQNQNNEAYITIRPYQTIDAKNSFFIAPDQTHVPVPKRVHIQTYKLKQHRATFSFKEDLCRRVLSIYTSLTKELTEKLKM